VASAGCLTFRTESYGHLRVLSVSGDLGAASSMSFTDAVERAAANSASSCRPARILVDLSGVRSIDFSGARALAEAVAPEPTRCRVVLRSLRPPLRQIVSAVCPDLDLTVSGLVITHPETTAVIDRDSPTWTLERESRRARFRAQQTVADIRRTAEMIAATEDKVADTLLRLAARRSGANGHLAALSQMAGTHAEQLRGATGNEATSRAGVPAVTPGPHNAATGTVQRAVAFINEHARDDISVTDIATAACVTTRAVQLAFRRTFGITPLGYLRQVRLEQAHRELLTASPVPGTVTRIAADWQFTNLSRFTARYRAAYGVLPSQTLQHATPGGSAR
jgi:AraC-like DNA-binding protein/anti-anti-sigma regulatory factor